MRQLIFLGCFSLLASAALADDAVVTSPSSAGGDKIIQPGDFSPKAETLPTIVIPDNPVAAKADCLPPQAVPESDADKLRKQRTQIAAKWIGSFRNTIKDTARSGNFFSTLFTSSKQPIDTELLGEMDSFIVLHPDMPEAADVYLLKSQVHTRMEAYNAAALDLLMLMTGYPDSPSFGEASKRLSELSGDQLKKQSSAIGLLTQKMKVLTGDHDHRVATYLADIGTTSNDANYAQPIATECALFLQSNRSFLDEDIVEHALARQSMLIDDRIAVYHFNKLLALYPSSPTRPDSLLSMGNVQRKGLKLYAQAAQSYSKLVEQYPEAPETKAGYLSLAGMYDEDMGDYPDALKTYGAVVARYKDDPAVLQSLRNMALIYQNKTGQPAKAIETYIKLSETFKGADALDALDKAENIATSSTRDWTVAMNINDRIIALAPKTDAAAKAAFANAEIAELNLKDMAQAKKLYSAVIDGYPANALAKEAQKRIAAIDRQTQP
ncbi:tol-pal system protein YbgF [mine drainage metagenome]|uniref:Tol-pal system protein YbgF n=1 Tax=mine drainage metagenome TaxID=410659 RepID=A0A1J5RTT8_9ZZZZ